MSYVLKTRGANQQRLLPPFILIFKELGTRKSYIHIEFLFEAYIVPNTIFISKIHSSTCNYEIYV